jgi:hypothetical protein
MECGVGKVCLDTELIHHHILQVVVMNKVF